MLAELIELALKQSEKELRKIEHIGPIDFFDFFPKSEKQKLELEREAESVAILLEKNVRGSNFYRFKKPLKTIFGELEYFKIRWVDETKISYIGSPDFVILDFGKFETLYGADSRFEFVEQKNSPAYKGFKYQSETTWACFLDTSYLESV